MQKNFKKIKKTCKINQIAIKMKLLKEKERKI